MSLVQPVLALWLAAVPGADLPDPRVLMDGLAERQQRFEEARNDYSCDLEVMSERLDKKGEVTSRKTRRYEVFYVKGKRVRRLVAEEGAALSPERQAKVDAKLQREVDELLRARARPPQDGDAELSELLGRYEFRAVAREEIDGRPVILLEFAAYPGKRDLKRDNILRRLAGRVWMDEVERVVVRAEIHSTGSIKIALGLGASIGAAEMVTEFARVDEGLWLPRRIQTRVRGRVLLVKGIHERTTGSFTRYRRFRVESSEQPSFPRP